MVIERDVGNGRRDMHVRSLEEHRVNLVVGTTRVVIVPTGGVRSSIVVSQVDSKVRVI